jgi:hypothetical protein
MTEEHVFGKWLLDFELETGRAVHVSGGINTLLQEQGTFVPFTQTVKTVCPSCNHGWLSELEADAKRTLTPILQGQATEITPKAALSLATWAFKTTLVSMLTFSKPEREAGSGVPEAEYRELYNARNRGLPNDTRAWLGRYTGKDVSSVWIVPHALMIDGVEVEPELPQGYTSTLVVGPVVIHAFRWTTPLLALDVEPGFPLAALAPAETTIQWPLDHPPIDDELLIEMAMGRRLSTGTPHTSLRPWGPATDAPPSDLVDGRITFPVICGLHSLSYPVELAHAALEGREHVFWGMCPCGQAYMIQTETDGAHLRNAGAPEAISSLYDDLPGEPIVIEDHLGAFACKRLVRGSGDEPPR